MEMCVRPWEKSQNLVTWAYTEKLTQYSTVEAFGFDRNISRQEAAAILARAGETLLELRYASYPDECNVLYKDEALFDLTLSKDIYSACAFDMMHGKDGYFSPFNSLTRAEALAVIMRAIDGGKKDEPNSTSWYLPYADRAHELEIFSFANFKGFNEAITRGELIEWLYRANLYIKKGAGTIDASDILGNWKLIQFNTTVATNPYYYLKFEQEKVSTKFCNSLFGSYSLSGNTISAPALASTMMYCE